MTLEGALAAGVSGLGLDLDDGAQTKLLAYVALLEKWNRTHNLTAIRAPARILTHHLLDALATLPHLPQLPALRLIDVGSGGGLPGVPLAIAQPGWRVTLLDSNRKKAAFLRQVGAELNLANIAVAAMRVEDCVPEVRFDIAISRGFAALSRFVATARHLVSPGGVLVALKGGYPHEELERLPAGIEVVALPKLDIPCLSSERHLVIMRIDEASK